MKFVCILASLIASGPLTAALPATENIRARQACDKPVILNATKNIWLDYTLHPNSIYQKQFLAATEAISDAEKKAKALKIADLGTFVWIETPDEVSKINEVVRDVPCNNILGLVLAGLPYKGCLSPRMPPLTTTWDYQSEFIDPIVKAIKANPNTAFALIIEPGVIANYLLNPDIEVCQNVKPLWYSNIPQALKSLDLPNVIQYLDAGHGGVFGYKDGIRNDLKSASKEFIDTWEAAGRPKQFRGVAVNVKSYNSWDLSPGEIFEDEKYCGWTKNNARNEQSYLRLLQDHIRKSWNSSMPFNNIMDTARSGVQGIRLYWNDWCNVNGASWGIRPTAKTRDSILDAFVWASQGGISDGTSDPSSKSYQSNCGGKVAFKPMPEKGVFSQAYFESMLEYCPVCGSNARRIRDVDIVELEKRCG